MNAGNLTPREIRRQGTHGVTVFWADGHQSDFSNQYLRDHCPCAFCREQSRKDKLPVLPDPGKETYPVQIGVVGRYAVSIQWSDGHDSGIYSYATLRDICPCPTCHAQETSTGGVMS